MVGIIISDIGKVSILSFVETCKLKNKKVLGFLKDFFDIVVSGRTDYDHMALAYRLH